MLFIIFFIQTTFALTCSNFYDYSNGNVICVDQCPSNSIKYNNVCCSSNQFYSNNICSNCYGWVTNNGTNCCNYGQYFSTILKKCIICNLQTYLNGQQCCEGCTYLDMNIQPPQCMKVGSGSCPYITCTSQQKVCCFGQYYFFLPLKQCLTRNGNMKCDDKRKLCCNIDQYLEYVNSQLACVDQCNYGINTNGIQCVSQKCSIYNNTVLSFMNTKGTLMAFSNNQCCYAIGINKTCSLEDQNCIIRFVSFNFSVCCPQDQFYDITTNVCIIICKGIVSLKIFCLPPNTYLDFSTLPPKIVNRSILCNDLMLPILISICCPRNMYLNGSYGCIYCRGKLFGNDNHQKCCLNDQFYDTRQKICKKCRGIVDNTGILCCNYNSYFSYDASGNMLCKQSCPLQMIQNYVYCCQICNNKCISPLLNCVTPSLCSPSYFNKNSCNSCSCGSCLSTTNLCVSCNNNISKCTQICSSGKVFDSSSQQCLNCDISCLQCLAPLDSAKCTVCNFGYIYYSGFCMICSINCLTCINEPNYCTSCFKDSNFPILLLNGVCAQDCESGYYLTSNLDCDLCNPICLTCYNNDAKSCITCVENYYMQIGNCFPCVFPCKTCISKIICSSCNDGFKLIKSNNSCVNICPQNTLEVLYLNSSNCQACHPYCINCTIIQTNCYSCKISYYLTNTSGFNTCLKCPIGCNSCISYSNCSGDCQSGYFLQNGLCLVCDTSCKTCNGSTNQNCLSCIVGIMLINNMCVGCAQVCQTCSSPTVCTTCKNSLLFFQGKCLTNCPNNTYLNNISCNSCDASCSSCVQQDTCLTCSPKFPYIDNNKCVVQCNSTSFMNGTNCNFCNGTVYSIGTACCPQGYIVQNQKCRKKHQIINNTIIVVVKNESNPQNKTNTTNNSSQNKNNTIFSQPVLFNSFVYTDALRLYIMIYCTNMQINYTLLQLRLINSKRRNMLQFNSTSLNYTIVQNNTNYIKVSLPITNDFLNSPLLQIFYQNYSVYTNKPYIQITQSSYDSSAYFYLSYIGYIVSCVLIIFIMLTKYKSHFQAEQTNRFIIHAFNFVQIVGMFQFYTLNDNLLYSFYKGFQYSHVDFIPNIFLILLPNDYIEGNQPNNFIIDANIIRNSGSIFTFQLFLLMVFLVSMLISFSLFWIYKFNEPPMIRKIFRIFIAIFSIGFMKETFFATSTLLYRSQNIKYPHISLNCFYFSIVLLCFSLIAMIVFFYHNYFTYFSDKQEHLYTLRQLSQHLQSYLQGIILALCVNRIPIFTIIGLELMWFIFNIFLYRQTEDVWRIKFYVSGIFISIGEVFLCFGSKISLVTLIVTTISIGILIIYCFYQVIGLYYWDFMKIFGIQQPQLQLQSQPQPEIKQEEEIVDTQVAANQVQK